MRTLNTSLTLVAAALVTLSQGAVSGPDRGAQNAFWDSGNGSVIRNGFGECYRTREWQPGDTVPGCGVRQEPADMAAMEPKPVTEPPEVVEHILKVSEQEKAFFEFDESTLTPAARQELDDLVARIGRYDELRSVQVSAYADRIGTRDYNQALSQRRGEAIKGYLAKRGIDPRRIEVTAHGESDPVVQCENTGSDTRLIACLAPNRRAQVTARMRETEIEVIPAPAG